MLDAILTNLYLSFYAGPMLLFTSATTPVIIKAVIGALVLIFLIALYITFKIQKAILKLTLIMIIIAAYYLLGNVSIMIGHPPMN